MPPTMPLLYIAILLVLACNIFLALAALGTPLLATFTEIVGLAKGSVFHRKLARQLSLGGLWVLLYSLIVAAAVGYAVYDRRPEFLAPWLANQPLWLPLAGALGALLLFGVLYAATWKALKDLKALHVVIGLLQSLGSLVSMAALAELTRLVATTPVDIIKLLEPLELAAVPGRTFPALTGMGAALALTVGGAWGLVYLLLRRNRDDFGRDYYGFALRFTAVWAALFAVVQLGFHAWAATLLQPWADPARMPIWAGAAGFSAVGTLLLGLAAASPTPLRHKPTIILAAVALVLSMAGVIGVMVLG